MATHIFIFLIFSLVLFLLCKKSKLFLDIKKDKHKLFASKQDNYFIGGLLLIFFIIIYFFKQNEYLHILFFLILFFIGLFADLKLLNNPKFRLFIQISILLIFVYFLEIKISTTRIKIFDILLNNIFFNYFFTVFCLAILLNGSNFVDGINTLLINYYILVSSIFLFFLKDMNIDYIAIQYLFSLLIIILLFNLTGKIILGDSGSYILSLFVGLILIQFSQENETVSPYFIILLVWYPCFELLFSMIRRLNVNFNSYEADTFHLHQMLLKLVKNKIKIKSNNINHFVAASIINLYNFSLMVFATSYYDKTIIILSIILMNIFIYVLSYFSLHRMLKITQN